MDGEDIASCPSCSLKIRVVFDDVRKLVWRLNAAQANVKQILGYVQF